MAGTVVYDSVNKLVWDEKDPKMSKTGFGVFGKSAKRFKSNVEARAYAIKLAKRNNDDSFYDKYYGEDISLRKKKLKNQIRKKINDPFGLPTMEELMRM